jgi:ribonuclease HI
MGVARLASGALAPVRGRCGVKGSGARTDVYTDGGASPNPGPGGWAAVVLRPGAEPEELSGGEERTTNNRMELTAAIAALEALERPATITVVTDSAYLRDGVSRWIHGWKRNGWRTADRKPVKNEDLWRRLDTAAARHAVTWEWVKGHAGHPENERADALAREGMAPFRPRKPAAAE